ncbi:MAG: ATP-binding cassette domain-containing protein, partial [Finegoldia magna]|nr:ATP-binding cassette domain-containing protein [Finegoldia magna]
MIEINNLKKDYEIVKRKSLLNKEKTIVNAVKNISFKIEDGERVGLIGLNGAGKTTTIKMMTGILYPTD